MSIKIAINGYGRIGRAVLRALYDGPHRSNIQIVAINDTGKDLKVQAHITQYDSIHGYFNHKVDTTADSLVIDNEAIKFFNERDPKLLPWASLGVDVVLDCTGVFTSKVKASGHLLAGAKKVIISAPCEADVDATVVYGVNDNILTKDMTVISNASCTTNCLAPIVKVLDDLLGIENGFMTTIHSYTSDQVIVDNYHSDLHRARAAAMSMIPTKTGAAKAVSLVLPHLKDKLDGVAIRVPTPNVSLVDLCAVVKRNTTKEEVNQALTEAANGKLKGVLAINQLPLVSIDFNHNPHSSILDAPQTRANGNLVKIFSWYDNEWGFSNRMLDNAIALMNAK